MPDNPHAGEYVLHIPHACESPATVAQTGGRYFGFVNGNVNTGAFDAFDAICEEARQAGAWVHVDGAFGLSTGIKPSTRLTTADHPLPAPGGPHRSHAGQRRLHPRQ